MTMKRFLLHIIYITALLPFLGSCSQSEDTPTDTSGNDHVQLSLSVTARALPQEGMEIGTGTPENMHLWVFGSVNDNQNTNGYDKLAYREINSPSFAGSDAFGNPVHTITDLDIPEGKKYTKMYFYVVLNSGSVVQSWNLDGETTISQLQGLTFSGIYQVKEDNEMQIYEVKEDNEMLMYGMSELEINPHKTNYETGIEVTRAVAKLELHFTKKDSNSELVIQKVTLSSEIGKGYLVPTPLLNDNTIYKDATNVALFEGSETIDQWLDTEEHYGNFSQHEGSFEELTLSAPYLMENPYGLDWTDHQADDKYPTNLPTDVSKYYKLTVDYVIDKTKDIETFYLPKIERNHLYKIYIRARSTEFELNWEAVPFDQVINDIPTFN